MFVTWQYTNVEKRNVFYLSRQQVSQNDVIGKFIRVIDWIKKNCCRFLNPAQVGYTSHRRSITISVEQDSQIGIKTTAPGTSLGSRQFRIKYLSLTLCYVNRWNQLQSSRIVCSLDASTWPHFPAAAAELPASPTWLGTHVNATCASRDNKTCTRHKMSAMSG